MRIDPKGMIGGYSALLVRKTLRDLRERFQWTVYELESAAALNAGRLRDAQEPGVRGAHPSREAGRMDNQSGGPSSLIGNSGKTSEARNGRQSAV